LLKKLHRVHGTGGNSNAFNAERAEKAARGMVSFSAAPVVRRVAAVILSLQ
jgi:hypothetical protein